MHERREAIKIRWQGLAALLTVTLVWNVRATPTIIITNLPAYGSNNDLGGVVLGYEAFKRTDQWKRGEKINGLTPDQRYFLGYALSWLGQRRPQALQQQIMTDVHAPAFLRVNGPLANIPEFYAAFGIKPGDAMYRGDDVRVVIW